jgi:hypothetical protein
MTRISPLLAVAATATLLAFGGVAYSATANGGDGGHSGGTPGGPNGGNSGGPASVAPRVDGCDFRADQMGFDAEARRSFLLRCRQSGAL